MLQDGLGIVRSVMSNTNTVLESRQYQPYGKPYGLTGTIQTSYGFTGEPLDSTNNLLYLRARYYAPNLGVFTARDPFEGISQRPMSLNGYSWVEGNTPNRVDPTGHQCANLEELLHGSNGYWCNQLREILHSQLSPPDFNTVNFCYSCAMDPSLSDSPEAYEQGLMQALRDGMSSEERIMNAIRAYRRDYVGGLEDYSGAYSNVITSALYGGNGYIEGVSLSAGMAVFGGITGREIVYNFANFESITFYYSGSGINTPSTIGVGFGKYVGYVAGFLPNPSCSIQNRYNTFISQYAGNSTVISGGVTAGAGVIISHFHSPVGTQNGVRGQSVTIQLGSPGVSAGAQDVTYSVLGDGLQKSYVQFDGKVDIERMTSDILNGNWSPLGQSSELSPMTSFADLLLISARQQAADAARYLALSYNASPRSTSCSC